MKKILSLIISFVIMVSAQFSHAQTYQRKQQSPNFFVPQNTLKVTHSSQNNQPNIQRQLARRQQLKTQEYQKHKAQVRQAQPKIKQNSAILSEKNNQKADLPLVTKPTENINQVYKTTPATSKTNLPTATNISKIPAENFSHNIQTSTKNEIPDPYELLWKEYRQDLTKISRGIPVNNPRLNQVISNFKNKDNTI